MVLHRLEREENERLAETKVREAARLKERLEAESRRSDNGAAVRFKGAIDYLCVMIEFSDAFARQSQVVV